MLKKFLTIVAAAALTFSVCTAVFAATSQVVRSESYAYWVVISNTSSNKVWCVLTATNGAYYDGYILAYSNSGAMRINDPTAAYSWSCARA